MKTHPTTPYTIRLDETAKQALEREALLEARPPAQLAALAITSMLDSRAARRAAIEAAMFEADSGTFISSASMGEWVDSWGTKKELSAPEADITA